jgi:hypothetical protein
MNGKIKLEGSTQAWFLLLLRLSNGEIKGFRGRETIESIWGELESLKGFR